jgi:hypothetical protein
MIDFHSVGKTTPLQTPYRRGVAVTNFMLLYVAVEYQALSFLTSI